MSLENLQICSPHLGISPESNSGGEVYERELLKHLAQLGVQIHIILARGKPHEQEVPNWVFYYLPVSPRLRPLRSIFLFPSAIRAVYQKKKFDLLRVHSLRYIGPLALWAKWRYRLNVPVVSHHHHLDRNPFNLLVERQVILGSDLVITDSRFSKHQLLEELRLNSCDTHIEVIPAGIDRRFRPLPKDPELSGRWGLSGKKVLLFMGYLGRRKNLFVLLEVLRRVVETFGNDVRLVICGTGNLLEPLKAKARRLGLEDKVIFPGFIAEADKPKFYNLADVFVFPSLLEGFGLAVGEAMSCGKPVVAFDSAAIPELVVNGETGLLARAGDVADFVKKTLTLLGNDELCRKMGQAGCLRIEREFRWEISARRVKETYESVVVEFNRRHAAVNQRRLSGA
jgi:glycosyltransferase involved in cell wall biosynthesis